MFNASDAKRGFILSPPPMGGLFRNVQQQAVKTILAVLALWKGARTYAHLLVALDESEIVELERQAFGA